MPLNPTELGLRRLTQQVVEMFTDLANSVNTLVATVGVLNKRLEALEAAAKAPEALPENRASTDA